MINQYEWLESKKSSTGSRAMLSGRGHRRNDKPLIQSPLCSRTGHSALKCREFQITHRERKPNEYHKDGEHGGNGGDGENGGGGGNDGEGGATVEVDAVKIASGAEVMSAQTLGLGRSSPQTLAPLWPHAAPCASGMKRSARWQTAVLPKI